MEKNKFGNKKNIEIKVQFEYLNNNNILDLSKEFKIKINLDDKTDFEANKKKILSSSNFKTQNERNNYHMFNKSKKKFLIQNSDCEQYIKTNSPVILINCYEYCAKVIEKLNEEINSFREKSTNNQVNELKKKEIINDLSCLENNFEVDIFADEFIFKNGMEILLTIIKYNCGEIRLLALKCTNKLLSFESAINFFIKEEKNLNTLFTSFIGNNEKDNEYVFYDIIIKLIGSNQEIITSFINMSNIYFYQKMIKFLDADNKDTDLKNYILFFINMILNFVDQKKQYELICNFINAGIFENLGKIIQKNENPLFEQINLLETTITKIIEDKNNKNDNDIKNKYNDYIENKKIYNIQKLIIQTNSENAETKNEALNQLNSILKENNNQDLIYEAYLKIGINENLNSFYNYYIRLFELEELNITNFINAAKRFSEKTKSKTLNVIPKIIMDIKYKNSQLRKDTFSFLNKILLITANSLNNKNYLELLYILYENGMFDYLEKNFSEKEEEFDKFKEILEKNLSKFEKCEKKYKVIKNKYLKLNEKKVYEDINDLLLQIHNSTSGSHLMIQRKLLSIINDENNFKIFFKMFAENDIKNLFFSFFEIFTMYCVAKENNVIKFIQFSDEYEKKLKINCYSKIVNYLDEYQNELVQVQALKLVNTLLNIKDMKFSYVILNKLYKLDIFDKLNDLIKKDEPEEGIKVQSLIFTNLVKDILKNNKKGENFKSLNKKFNKLIETVNMIDDE